MKREPRSRADLIAASRTLRGRIKLAEQGCEAWARKDYDTALWAVEMILKLTERKQKERTQHD